jgi:hypothetical protein
MALYYTLSNLPQGARKLPFKNNSSYEYQGS